MQLLWTYIWFSVPQCGHPMKPLKSLWWEPLIQFGILEFYKGFGETLGSGTYWTCAHTSSETNSSMSTTSKVSSSLALGPVTAARAAASLLLKVKPLQKACKDPREKNGTKQAVNHVAHVNIARYPITEIKHVNLSFNCLSVLLSELCVTSGCSKTNGLPVRL